MCNLQEEKKIDVEYNMIELVDFVWGRKIHLGLDLNEEPMKGNDRPTPIVKIPQANENAQLLSNFVVEHHERFQL
jgi:hypothetical protein